MGKKNTFQSLRDLELYCQCKPQVRINVYARLLDDYEGMVDTVDLYSEQSGLHFRISRELESAGLDQYSDTFSKLDSYHLISLEQLPEFLRAIGCSLNDLHVRRWLPGNYPETDYDNASYREAWQRFERDYDAGKFELPLLERSNS